MAEGKKRYQYALGEIATHHFATKTIEQYDWDDNDILRIAVEQQLDQEKWHRGLGLVGWTGVGKTHLLVAMYKERYWRAINTDDERPQIPVYASFTDLQDIYSTKGPSGGRSGLTDVLRKGGVVFIDDLFITGYGDKEREVVTEVVTYCYDTNKVLCFTSNIMIEDSDLDPRIKRRLLDMCDILQVHGEGYTG